MTRTDLFSINQGKSVTYSEGDRVERIILDHASRNPDIPALRWRDQIITYGDMAERATATAGALSEAGVRPGDIVTVWMDLTPDLITTLLGVLLTGAAYSGLPIDWPAGRVARSVRTCESRLVVTDLADAGTELAGVDVLHHERLRTQASTPTPSHLDGTTPWCVFLTSGSSGTPKAVASPHRGIIRLLHDPRLRLDANTVSLVRAPTAWDGFAFELWLPLLAGGSCVLGDPAPPSTAEVRALLARGVNWMMLPSSLFGVLVEDDVQCLAGARTIVVGGERMGPQQTAACRRAHPSLNLINAYGPVEGCAYVTAHVVGDETGEIPIGTAAPNTTVYVLDQDRRVLPRGERGEVAISGDGVAVGYLGDATETAARFPTLPLGPDGAPVRVYLTGDLATADEDGVLWFAGRADRQVKVRGVRIELDEVERAVAAVDGVGHACALGLPADSLTKVSLAAFYSTLDDSGPSVDDVRAALATVLPPMYVPDTVVRVGSMPLTDNGKADIAALSALAPQPGEQTNSVPGQDGVLGVVSRIATDLLGFVPDADLDLFARGASSLTAVRLANRLGRELGCTVTGADVLAARTMNKLTEVVSTRPRILAPAPIVAPSDGPTRIQAGFRFLEQATPGSDDLLCPLVYVIRGELDANALRAALLSVIDEHDALRTTLTLELRTGKVAATVVPPEDVPDPLMIADPVDSEDAATAAAVKFVRRPLMLDRQVPLRAMLQPFGDQCHVLGIVSHHTAVDGWSLERITHAITEGYRDLMLTKDCTTGATTHYADVFARQEAAVEPKHRQSAVEDWRTRLAGIPAPDIGRRLNVIRTAPVRELDLGLDSALAARVERWAVEVGRMAFAGYVAAYARALHRVFGLESVPVNLPVLGRTLPEAEKVVGPFSNNVVLGLHDLHAGVDAVAANVTEQMAAVLDCPVLDFDDVVAGLVPDNEVWNTFYQVNFVVQQNALDTLELPPARTQFVRVTPRASTMKLRMELWLTARPHGTLAHRTDCVRDDEAREVVTAWTAELEALLRRGARHV